MQVDKVRIMLVMNLVNCRGCAEMYGGNWRRILQQGFIRASVEEMHTGSASQWITNVPSINVGAKVNVPNAAHKRDGKGNDERVAQVDERSVIPRPVAVQPERA